LDEKSEFGEDFGENSLKIRRIYPQAKLGSHLHPHFSTLTPLVDDFQDKLSTGMNSVVLTRPYVIPSQRFSATRYPSTLIAHLSTMIPPHLDTSQSSDTLNTLASSVDTIRAHRGVEPNTGKPGFSKPSPNDGGSGNFLGMPVMTMNMDMRKWNWPGYLSFGKSNSPRPAGEKPCNPTSGKEKPETASIGDDIRQEASQVEVDINRDALEDAISSDSISLASRARNGSVKEVGGVDKLPNTNESDQPPDDKQLGPEVNQVAQESTNSLSSTLSVTFSDRPDNTLPASRPPLPEFSMTKLYLAPFQDPTNTRRVAVHYHIVNLSNHPVFHSLAVEVEIMFHRGTDSC